RVPRDLAREARELLARRQLAVEQQPRDLEEGALLGELLDRVSAVAQDPLLAVDEADGGAARPGVAVAGVERDQARVLAQARDVDRALVLGPFDDRERVRLAVVLQRRGPRSDARSGGGSALALLFDAVLGHDPHTL